MIWRGSFYTTSCPTLTKYPESMLGVMFSGRHDIEAMKCSDGIDRDGACFRHILDWLLINGGALSFPNDSELHKTFYETNIIH